MDWMDLFSQGIQTAGQVAAINAAGYPPQGIYAPNIQYGQPYPYGQPVIQQPLQPVAPAGSLQLSNTTLMLIVGGVLLFMLGKRR